MRELFNSMKDIIYSNIILEFRMKIINDYIVKDISTINIAFIFCLLIFILFGVIFIQRNKESIKEYYLNILLMATIWIYNYRNQLLLTVYYSVSVGYRCSSIIKYIPSEELTESLTATSIIPSETLYVSSKGMFIRLNSQNVIKGIMVNSQPIHPITSIIKYNISSPLVKTGNLVNQISSITCTPWSIVNKKSFILNENISHLEIWKSYTTITQINMKNMPSFNFELAKKLIPNIETYFSKTPDEAERLIFKYISNSESFGSFCGHILGDGGKKTGDQSIVINQSIKHFPYSKFIYNEAKGLFTLKLNLVNLDGKVHVFTSLTSKSHKVFTELFKIFYNYEIDEQGKIKFKQKRIPPQIMDVMNETCIQRLFFDDGCLINKGRANGNGFKIATNCFSKSELIYLQKGFENFNIKTKLQAHNDQWVIVINDKESKDILRQILLKKAEDAGMSYKVQPIIVLPEDVNGDFKVSNIYNVLQSKNISFDKVPSVLTGLNELLAHYESLKQMQVILEQKLEIEKNIPTKLHREFLELKSEIEKTQKGICAYAQHCMENNSRERLTEEELLLAFKRIQENLQIIDVNSIPKWDEIVQKNISLLQNEKTDENEKK